MFFKLLLKNWKLHKELEKVLKENYHLRSQMNPECTFYTLNKADKLVLEGYKKSCFLYKVKQDIDGEHWYWYYVPFSSINVEADLNRQYMEEHKIFNVPSLTIERVELSMGPKYFIPKKS